jgi:hypothetical protein
MQDEATIDNRDGIVNSLAGADPENPMRLYREVTGIRSSIAS